MNKERECLCGRKVIFGTQRKVNCVCGVEVGKEQNFYKRFGDIKLIYANDGLGVEFFVNKKIILNLPDKYKYILLKNEQDIRNIINKYLILQ